MKSRSFLMAAATALAVVAAPARASYFDFNLTWSGQWVLSTCSCEDPENGDFTGFDEFTTPNRTGTYSGQLGDGLSYTVSVQADPTFAEGTVTGFSAQIPTGEGSWDFGGSENGSIDLAVPPGYDGYGYGQYAVTPGRYVFAIPEPSSALMLALGLALAAVRRSTATRRSTQQV